MQYIGKAFALRALLICMLLNACTGNIHAPVSSRDEPAHTLPAPSPQQQEQANVVQNHAVQHIVTRGDTLYSIAWNYGFDYRDVAQWNGITSPYVIYPGQVIRLQKPLQSGTRPLTSETQPLTPGPIVIKKSTEKTDVTIKNETAVKQEKTVQKKSEMEPASGPIRWIWPTQGTIIKSDTPISKKGIDIAGQIGQQINASAPGEVVYSGSGLLGYGRLIIIKHNDTYLSAYAHNRQLMVKEGDQVSAGQQIAQMGQTNNGRTLLHFEIRKNGQPENPLNYLPEL